MNSSQIHLRMCRACLSTDSETFHNFFNGELATIFCKITSLCVDQEDDGLPTVICSDCCKSLKDYDNFRTLCLKTNETLQQMVNEYKVKQENDKELECSSISIYVGEISSSNIASIVKKERLKDCHGNVNELFDCGNKEQTITSHIEPETSSTKAEIIQRLSVERKHKERITRIHSDYIKAKIQNECPECRKKFRSLNKLENHLMIHTSKQQIEKQTKKGNYSNDRNRQTTCSVCSKTFSSSISLKRHQLIHSGKKPYLCSICAKDFNQLSNLKLHMLHHTGLRPHACSICPERFVQLSNLKSHMLTHSGIKSHVCSVCDQRFTHSSNLKRHMKTHSDLRPFGCDLCGKQFRYSANLKRHRGTHTGDRQFICSICGKGLTRMSHLRGHMKIHANKDKN